MRNKYPNYYTIEQAIEYVESKGKTISKQAIHYKIHTEWKDERKKVYDEVGIFTRYVVPKRLIYRYTESLKDK